MPGSCQRAEKVVEHQGDDDTMAIGALETVPKVLGRYTSVGYLNPKLPPFQY